MRHKYRHTNHHTAASLPFKFVRASLGVAHNTNATRPTARTTAPPCPSSTRRTRGTGRAVACEAEYFFRVVVVASSSVVRLGRPETPRNAATGRKRSAPPRNATNGDPKSSGSAVLRTCLVAFFNCDAAAGRPCGREHFSYLGRPGTSLGQAINQKRSEAERKADRERYVER